MRPAASHAPNVHHGLVFDTANSKPLFTIFSTIALPIMVRPITFARCLSNALSVVLKASYFGGHAKRFHVLIVALLKNIPLPSTA